MPNFELPILQSMPLKLQITSIQPIGPSGRLIRFQKPEGWVHQPGQYLTLLLNIEGQEVRRSYSLCSLPEEAPAIAVERVTNGLVSRWLIAHVKPGDVLESLPPTGRFVLEEVYPPLLVFVAAGSGITAVLPLIRQSLASRQGVVKLVYACKNRHTAWFGAKLMLWALENPDRFELHWYESQPDDDAPRHLGNLRLEELVNSWPMRQKAHYYLCGPFAFMRMVRITLGFMEIPETAIHQENFASEGQRFFIGKSVSDESVACEIHYRKGDKSAVWMVKKGETVLQSAKKAGIHLDYSCENGFCGTCILHKKSGEVVHRINEFLTDAELAAGWILSCSAYPTTPKLWLEELNTNP